MGKVVLGKNSKLEIVESIERCRSAREISTEVGRLAARFGVSRQAVYKISESVRPRRKIRCDRGDRLADLNSHDGLRLAAGWVLEYGVNPAEAIVMARSRGVEIPVEFPTLNRYLRESGLNHKYRRNPVEPHRRFEASAPGEIFQFDMSGLKQRWFDCKTRRILNVSPLEISKNHPNDRPERVPVWRFVLVDDFSRRVFLRYVAVQKANGSHVVDFLLQAYSELGVPQKLYTDNDAVIKGGRNAKTTEILHKILVDQGGYENIFHLPGNARATGKVERLNETIENCEKFIGIYIAERGSLTIEQLNAEFAPLVMEKLDFSVHSETGQRPVDRWESRLSVIRRLDYESLKSAFMVDEWPVKLRGDLTIRVKGGSWQLPTSDRFPFANWIGQKIRVVFPDDQEFFTVIGLDGLEYDIAKLPAGADVAGEFKSTRETDAARLKKDLRSLAREDAKKIRTGSVGDRAVAPIVFFEQSAIEQTTESSNVYRLPKPQIEISPEMVAAVAPGRVAEPYAGRQMNFWEAFSEFQSSFASVLECKSFLDSIFTSRDAECWLTRSEIESSIADLSPRGGDLRLVRAG